MDIDFCTNKTWYIIPTVTLFKRGKLIHVSLKWLNYSIHILLGVKL